MGKLNQFNGFFEIWSFSEGVALKKINTQQEKQGFPITAIREIKILQNLNHPNVIKLIDVCTEEIR